MWNRFIRLQMLAHLQRIKLIFTWINRAERERGRREGEGEKEEEEEEETTKTSFRIWTLLVLIKYSWPFLGIGPGGPGVLPYISYMYMSMCRLLSKTTRGPFSPFSGLQGRYFTQSSFYTQSAVHSPQSTVRSPQSAVYSLYFYMTERFTADMLSSQTTRCLVRRVLVCLRLFIKAPLDPR